MSKIKKLILCILGVVATVSVVALFANIESANWVHSAIFKWIIIFTCSIILIVIVDRPSRVYRYLIAFNTCRLAWLYFHKLTKNKKAKYCAVLKHRYLTYSKLYDRIVEYYKYEYDDGPNIFN